MIRLLVICAVLAGGGCGDSSSSDDGDDGDDAELTADGYLPDADPTLPGPFAAAATHRTIEHTAIDGDTRPLDVIIWYPTEASADTDFELDPNLDALIDAPLAAGASYPTIGFSHGQGAESNQSRFLVSHLASHGFVVIAPGHPGSMFSECMFSCSLNFVETSANRPADLVAAVEAIVVEAEQDDGLLAGAIDASRMGVIGHSFGGFTVLGVLAGESADRFKAGIGMAPLANPGAPPNITAPFMVMGGEQDATVSIGSMRSTYAGLPEDNTRYFLYFPNGGHFAYSDICLEGCTDAGALDQKLSHELTKNYVTAFLQHHVAGTERSELLDADDNIADGEARLAVGELTF